MGDMDQEVDAELRTSHLIETEDLAKRIASGDSTLRIVDMRGAVKTTQIAEGVQTADYCGSRSEYDLGHIPGAIYLDWTRDIVDLTDSVAAQAAPADKVKSVFEAAGIGDHNLIVAYDAHPASQFATRLWWLMKYYGNKNVRVLNGGWKKWIAEQRPVSTETPTYPAARFTPRRAPEWRVISKEVAGMIGSPDTAIVDARDPDQYTGRIRRGSRGGHIPGALNIPRELLFSEDGTYKPPAELAHTFVEHGIPVDKHVVAYCNGGVAATSVLFALSMLGYRRLSNYDGSWNEWAELEEMPVEG